MAAPKQMNMFVRRPAGLCFVSRSNPMAAPSRDATSNRATNIDSIAMCCCGKRRLINSCIGYGSGECAGFYQQLCSASHAFVEHAALLSRNMENCERLHRLRMLRHHLGHLVAIKGEHVIALRQWKRKFLFAFAMTALVPCSSQWDPRALEDADVFRERHDKR